VRLNTLSALLPLWLVSSAGAELIYTVNVFSNRLAAIDTQTHQVGFITPGSGMGIDVSDGLCDLTYANGYIYGVDSDFNSQGVSRIFKIDPASGMVVGAPQILHRPNGATTTDSDGIATLNDGRLAISYRAQHTEDGGCDAIGIVDPDTGQISQENSFFFGPPATFDFDALAVDNAGILRAMDNGADGPGQNYIEITLAPPLAVIIAQNPGSSSAANDIVFTPSALYSIRGAGVIQTHNAVDGSLTGGFMFSLNGAWSGLAYIPIPEPATLTILAIAGGLIRCRRRAATAPGAR
jgi:hypothetical protein